jgi:hypothetical protein
VNMHSLIPAFEPLSKTILRMALQGFCSFQSHIVNSLFDKGSGVGGLVLSLT